MQNLDRFAHTVDVRARSRTVAPAVLAGCLLSLAAIDAQAPAPPASPAASAPAPTDWPQWRGPDRTGLSRETGLLKEWPKGGPSAVWATPDLGAGYGSLAVRGDRVYVQGSRARQS